MTKFLLIGASALALSTAAYGQSVPIPNNVQANAVSVGSYNTLDVSDNGVNYTSLDAQRPSTDNNGNGQTNFATEGAAAVDPADRTRAANFDMSNVDAMTQAVDASVPEKMVQAGNKANIDQGANADPTFTADDNEAIINQDQGNQGWAAIQQDNDNNSARVVQSETGTAGGMTVNRAYIQQNGFYQQGTNDRNTADIRQRHDATGADNIAVILQGNANPTGQRDGSNNGLGTVEQNGSDNRALITQARDDEDDRGDDNVAHIDQVGQGNRAAVSQEEGADGAISQNGLRNEALIRQNGTQEVGQFADIVQTTNDNFGAINQEGSNQTASIFQEVGDLNQAFIEQTELADGARAAVHQQGSTNYADVLQAVGNVQADVLQRGSGNVALVNQFSAASSQTSISSVGNNNNATVRQ